MSQQSEQTDPNLNEYRTIIDQNKTSDVSTLNDEQLLKLAQAYSAIQMSQEQAGSAAYNDYKSNFDSIAPIREALRDSISSQDRDCLEQRLRGMIEMGREEV